MGQDDVTQGKHAAPRRTQRRSATGLAVAGALLALAAMLVVAGVTQGVIPLLSRQPQGRPAAGDASPAARKPAPNGGASSDATTGANGVPDGSKAEGAAQPDQTDGPATLADQLPSEARPVRAAIDADGGSDALASSDGYAKLTQAVGALEDRGHSVSFYLKDLSSGATLSYQPDVSRYPASSIKGPYLVAIYETMVETGQVDGASVSDLAQSLILSSDNDAFRALHRRFGESILGTWLRGFGFDTTGFGGTNPYTTYYYPYVTARQLARIWEHMNEYLSSGTDGANYLASLFARRDESPLAMAVGPLYGSWGKAGWYPSHGALGAAPATVDAGVVFAGPRPYVVVAMSDAPSDFAALALVFAGLDAAHDDL
ncbi:serine hydrolase [Olsenella sp. HMSC062G07]|uniref:serine hydrolase n=1 Tax=Olsenella sp. HMSC062G07 TaxID=1739330 RepID=UPI0008A4BE37|nr:serine hydrolase [Olsenella sp. HMSC062G07]OFK23876.1 hypothetical protein HMPREF2826_03755 [Olsenella sp. HMSC062G07]